LARRPGRKIGATRFLVELDIRNDLAAYREYVGGPPAEDYSAEETRFHQDTAITMEPEQAGEYERVESTLVSTCRETLQKGPMKLLGAMLNTALVYPDRRWDWKTPTGNTKDLAAGYWLKREVELRRQPDRAGSSAVGTACGIE
jgi:hypothetical protein